MIKINFAIFTFFRSAKEAGDHMIELHYEDLKSIFCKYENVSLIFIEKESKQILAQKIVFMHLFDNLYKDFFRTKVKKIVSYKIGVYNAKWTFTNCIDKRSQVYAHTYSFAVKNKLTHISVTQCR